MGGSTQPLLAYAAELVLAVLHLAKLLVHDPLVALWATVASGGTDKQLVRFYGGKTVVITGASSGVGEACALQLAALRCNLVLCARNLAQLNAVAAQCRSLSPSSHVHVIALDLEEVAQDKGAGARFTTALNAWFNEKGIASRIDVLLNVAGVSSRGSALDTDASTLKKVMDINFVGPANLTRDLLPLLLSSAASAGTATNPAAIGVVSSVQGRLGIPLRTSYAASKHALQGFFDCLRAELHKKLTVTVISPGYVATNLSSNALTGDGRKYGKTDETTAKGMSPQLCARRSLVAVARGEGELVLADAKTCTAVQARAIFPSLLFKMVRDKGK